MENNEVYISDELAKKYVGRSEALERLYGNDDFKSLIMEGYLKEEAQRLVLLRADFNINDKIKSDIDNKIIGIGQFNQYLNIVRHLGQQSKMAMEQAEE